MPFPRFRTPLLVLPLALGLGLAPAASAMETEDSPTRQRIALLPSIDVGGLPGPTVVGDGAVRQVVQRGGVVYALGSFDEIGSFSGPGRVLDAETGADRPGPVFDDGQVSVTLADGAGGWYVGGDYAIGVRHVLADGTLDPDFHVGVQGLVTSLARDGDTLYLGGLFGNVAGEDRHDLAAVSASDGSLLPFDVDVTGYITELALAPASGSLPTTLYIASPAGVTALDPATGDSRWTSSGFDDHVRALELGDGVVYVGTGELVAIDQESGATVETFDTDLDSGVVHTLLLDGDRLYVGSDGSGDRLAVVDAATGEQDPSFDPGVAGGEGSWGAPGGVFDLSLDGDRLWAGGAFTEAGGEPAGGLAVLDAATGAATGTDVPGFHQQVNSVEVSGGAAYVGGHFYLADPHRTSGLAALDADTLLPVPGFRATGPIRYGDLTVSSNALYVAPTHFHGYTRPHPPYFWNTTATVHAYDRQTGATLPGSTRKVKGLTGITAVGDRLVVAQRLQNDVRYPRNRITVYGPTGAEVTSWQVPLRGYVTHLNSVRGDLLVAGSFKRTAPNGGPRDTALLRLDLQTGKRRAYFDTYIDGPVGDVAVQGGSIFATGLFDEVNQIRGDFPGLAKFDSRSSVNGQFDPVVRSTNSASSTVPIGSGVVWADADPQNFLDSTTGENLGLVPWLGRYNWIHSATGDADTVVVAGEEWTGLAGEGALKIGYVTAKGY